MSIVKQGNKRGELEHQFTSQSQRTQGDILTYHENNLATEDTEDTERFNKKLLRGVQGGGFLEKSPPGRRRQSS